jgi:hypothetical protein
VYTVKTTALVTSVLEQALFTRRYAVFHFTATDLVIIRRRSWNGKPPPGCFGNTRPDSTRRSSIDRWSSTRSYHQAVTSPRWREPRVSGTSRTVHKAKNGYGALELVDLERDELAPCADLT